MKDLVRRHPGAAALAAYVALALVATWPLAARFGSEIAGDRGAPWETLWSFWWWGESVARRGSPFFSDALRWPHGLGLWPQVANVPAALVLLPLWPATPHVPEVALYNAVLFASYPLAGFTTYLLCREVWGGQLAPFLAGAIYTFGAHHLGAAAGPLEAVSMQWSPLYFLGLVGTVRRHGAGPPLVAGVALALSALTSPYHLAFCAVGTVVLLVSWARTDPRSVRSPAFVRRAALLAITSLVLAGWMYAGLLVAPGPAPRRTAAASADLLAFLVPGWSFRAHGGTGPILYAGYLALALAGVAWMRAKASRPWLAIALVGFVLALGARVHVAGVAVTPALLPYAWIGWAFPSSAAAANPARFGWLVAFGLAIGGCAALSLIVRAHHRGAWIAIVLTAAALAEAWPGTLPTSRWPAPVFLRNLAKDGERWAVLDASAPDRQLWHQVLHRHPQLGGIAPPRRLDSATTGSPILDGLLERRPSPAAVSTNAAFRQDAIRALQQRNVRFVIADEVTAGAARALRLPPAFVGDGLLVFEVPAPTG